MASLISLIYRTADLLKWGSGKGSNLTAADFDNNNWSIVKTLQGIQDALPALVIGIDYFSVTGDQLTVFMTDHSMRGPYTLTSYMWKFRGEWTPETLYTNGDVFSQGGKTYLVLLIHVSALTFDPGATNGTSPYYSLMLSNPDPIVDLAIYFPDHVRAAGAVYLQHVAVRSMTMPVGLAESRAYLRVAPATQNVTLLLFRNSDQIGTLLFSAGTPDIEGGKIGIFTFSSEIVFNSGDRFSIKESIGTQDDAALGLSVTIKAVAS